MYTAIILFQNQLVIVKSILRIHSTIITLASLLMNFLIKVQTECRSWKQFFFYHLHETITV